MLVHDCPLSLWERRPARPTPRTCPAHKTSAVPAGLHPDAPYIRTEARPRARCRDNVCPPYLMLSHGRLWIIASPRELSFGQGDGARITMRIAGGRLGVAAWLFAPWDCEPRQLWQCRLPL